MEVLVSCPAPIVGVLGLGMGEYGGGGRRRSCFPPGSASGGVNVVVVVVRRGVGRLGRE